VRGAGRRGAAGPQDRARLVRLFERRDGRTGGR
jgi:hypothetical protein